MNRYAVYPPSTVHRMLAITSSVKGWKEARQFLSCYREMSEEGQAGIDQIISSMTNCFGMGPLSAAELLWAIIKLQKAEPIYRVPSAKLSIETILK